MYCRPFEWTSIDFCSFLLSASKNYDLLIKNIKTTFSAIEDEYEASDKLRQYEGAYKWILKLREKEPNKKEILLFNKFFTDTASASDIEQALIYADRIVPIDKEKIHLSKEIFTKILDYTSFSITLDTTSKNKLNNDIKSYLELFIKEDLIRNNKSKRIKNTLVSQSQNIFTFKKHSSLFNDYLQKMQNDFGSTITIENIFEDGFPDYECPGAKIARKRYAERNFFFLHILLAFEKKKLLRILYIGNNWDFYEDKMLTYQAKIEILPKFINKDLSKKLRFDVDKARFYVQGKEIKLLKFKDEYHTLRIMFENPKELSKEWFFSEILEKIDDSNFDDKKYYNAIYQLKIKLAKQGIEDFFITTKQSVKINEKYLS